MNIIKLNKGIVMEKYKIRIKELITKYQSIESKRILEIGGTPNENEIALELINQCKAKEIFQINIRSDLSDITEGDIKYYNMDARETVFEDNTFDIIYGTAVLEHIHLLSKFFDEMYRVLKYGGMIFLHGGPLWNCKLGHHLWIHTEKNKYEFNSNNPIDDWSHLYLTPAEMKLSLGNKNLSKDDIERIINGIYYSDIINRVSYQEIMTLIKKSKFELVEIEAQDWGKPQRNIENKISMDYLNIGAVSIVLKKIR